MKDINTELQRAYFDALSALPYPVYEGVEPDNENSELYIVIGGITISENSPKQATAINANVPISIHSRKTKVNRTQPLNTAAGEVFTAIHPSQLNTLTAAEMSIIETRVTADNTTRERIAESEFLTRQIIFSHTIFY